MTLIASLHVIVLHDIKKPRQYQNVSVMYCIIAGIVYCTTYVSLIPKTCLILPAWFLFLARGPFPCACECLANV